MRLALFSLLLLAAGLGLAPAGAQEAVNWPLAALELREDCTLALYSWDASARPLGTGGEPCPFAYPTWSPDGRSLAVLASGDAGAQILISDALGTPPVPVADSVSPQFAPAFTPDGEALVYAVERGDNLDLYRLGLAAGMAPELLGSIPYDTSCQRDSAPRLPHDFARAAEAPAPALLAVTTFGILHNRRCGGEDLWLFNPVNGENYAIFEQTDGVFVAPDGSRAVVVQGGSIFFVQSEDGPYTQVTLRGVPDRIGFGDPATSEIVYSTRVTAEPTPLSPELEALLSGIYFNLPMNHTVSLRRFRLRTGIDEELYRTDAYSLDRLMLTADGQTLVFSQVPNPDDWAAAVAGAAVPADDPAGGGLAGPQVYALNLGDGSARLIGTGWRAVALHPAAQTPQFRAPAPPTYTPFPTPLPPTLPPTLTPRPAGAPTPNAAGLAVGMQVTISDGITNLNVRERPGTGASVLAIIAAGTRVTLLDGPQAVEGFTWWQVALPDGAIGWIAESIGGVLTMTP